MPNRDVHMEHGGWAGLLAAGVVNILSQAERKRLNPAYQFNFPEFVTIGALGTAGGILGGVAPDLIEPAIHPGHRDFFHSVTAGILILYALHKANGPTLLPLSKKLLINALGVGYLSHLALDGRTPAGLPLLSKR